MYHLISSGSVFCVKPQKESERLVTHNISPIPQSSLCSMKLTGLWRGKQTCSKDGKFPSCSERGQGEHAHFLIGKSVKISFLHESRWIHWDEVAKHQVQCFSFGRGVHTKRWLKAPCCWSKSSRCLKHGSSLKFPWLLVETPIVGLYLPSSLMTPTPPGRPPGPL